MEDIQQSQIIQPETPFTCQYCGSVVGPDSNFCPVCGKLLKEQPLGVGRQIYIYAVSFFLPPLGLIWTFRYLKKDEKFRKVGLIAAVLTVISIILTIWFFIGFMNSVQQQLNQYQNLGL